MAPEASSIDAPSANPIPPSLRIEVLQELADAAASLANKQIDGFVTRLADAMLDAARTAGEEQAKQLAASAALLKRNRYPFYYVMSERLGAALHNEVLAVEYPGTVQESAAVPASLPPELEVDKKLCLVKAARAIETENTTRLTALNIRLASLLGREALQTAQNPFRPHIFLSVIHESWCEFQPDAAAHHLVYRMLGPSLCLDLAPVLHTLNMALIKRGIVPHLPASALVATLDEERKSAPGQDEAAMDPVMRQLRRLFPSEEKAAAKTDRALDTDFPSLFAEDAVHATASRNELMGFLSAMQRKGAAQSGRTAMPFQVEILDRIRREAPVGALSATDTSVINLLKKIFGMVFADDHIADEMKAMIGALQVPVLKAAVQDKDFFFKTAHPARRVVDLMARLAVGWDRQKGNADPLYVLIERNVKRIQQESEQRMAVFADVAAELMSFIKRDETATEQVLVHSIGNALQQEKHDQCVKAAKNDVAMRVGTGEVVAFVETFLEDKWVNVLTLAYGVKEDKPQAAENAIKTMDDLCWSVKPKITAAERKELLAKLPSMLVMLNKWLDLIKWHGDDRAQFFTELAETHASLMRAPLELSPERQMQIALAIAKHAAERRAQRQAQQQPEPEPDEFDQMVDELERGTWIAFKRKDGSEMKIKLAWVSPMRSLYIFSTKDRQEALSISAEGLAQALREERASVVSISGLVGKALASVFGAESANEAALEAKPAA
ncbi:DUF1631 family protein [Noviherbaspirillum denitrificans]|uniref:Thymidine phosphorylase n=1 Tax=Noviherbaspirillum denitrificans TaxID=1968433 RepID=A0A254TBJ8_9BURK|nr:DUF1631 family protein [Noviherbaspirillum denitrificans]OWW18652.1 hypothetical protein AYR66_03485 [Noviherbaspirillum denitrificans]